MEPPSTSPSSRSARDRQAHSFGQAVDAYDRGRPRYPDEAIPWLVPEPGSRVLELGAGTGKLTAQLVRGDHRVLATDPSPEMLHRLTQRVPEARAALGTAEQVPVRNSSIDAVVAAQAFHWFDHDRALREVARVLRPGGTLALIWNHRDERVPWVRRLGEIIAHPGTDDDPVPWIDDSGLFEQVETAQFRFWQQLTRESLHELCLSRSHVILQPEAARSAMLEQLDELYADYGRGADGMLLPYLTTAYRTRALPWAQPGPGPEEQATSETGAGSTGDGDALDTDSLLIDFR